VTETATSTGSRTASRELLARQAEALFPAVRPLYAEPVVLDRGRGVWVEDVDGNGFLDLFAGILTTSVGHCHPDVVEAVAQQAGRLGHTSTLYATEPQVEAAERLKAMAPGSLSRTFFTNSGTEAVETALTLAQIHTGRSEIIALRQAYHGRSTLASNVTAHASWRPLATSVPGIKHTLSPYPYRCPFNQPCDDSCAEAFAADLEDVIRTTTNGQPAALICETIQGVGGYIVPPPRYFQLMAEVIRKHGGLLIIDEVQAGFGRTGDHWFGIEHWGVQPDIMVMAKGIAGGMPVGATMARPEIAESWTGKTISTFGGHPVCMAGMVATLDVMEEADVRTNASVRGAEIRSALSALQADHPWVGDVRGMGLMQAMELVEDPETKSPSPMKAKALMEAAKAEQLLIGIGGLHGHVIRIGPSLLLTEDECTEAMARLRRAVERVSAES